MFGSQEGAVDLKPGEMCKLLKFCPVWAGKKGGGQANLVSGGFVLVRQSR